MHCGWAILHKIYIKFLKIFKGITWVNDCWFQILTPFSVLCNDQLGLEGCPEVLQDYHQWLHYFYYISLRKCHEYISRRTGVIFTRILTKRSFHLILDYLQNTSLSEHLNEIWFFSLSYMLTLTEHFPYWLVFYHFWYIILFNFHNNIMTKTVMGKLRLTVVQSHSQ